MNVIETRDSSRAGLREWVGLAVLALPTLLVSIDVSVMLLALPRIVDALGANSAEQLWILDIYGFLLAGFMITMGTLGDRIGRRKLLMIGSTGFGLASLLAAFSTTPWMLIAARALLGIAGATLSPSILALITNMFRNPAERGLAISVWLTCFMGGMAVGPLVGGLLLQQFWWGAIYLLGVPVMLLLLAAAPAFLPEYRDERAGRLDLASVGLSLATILPVVYGLKEFAKSGLAPIPALAILIGVLVGVVFVRRQAELRDPLFDLKLFRNRAFTAAIVGMFFATTTGAIMLFNAQYLQLVLGLSPLEAGLWTLPGVVAMIGSLLVSPILARRISPARLISTGLTVAALGLVVLLFLEPRSGIAAVVLGFALFNGGCGPMVTLASGIVVGSVPPERAGSAAALQETCSEFGFALGIAVFGSLGAVLYRGQLAAALPPDVPVETARAAGDTLAAAARAAQNLTGPSGEGLLAAARQAFLYGMNVVAALIAAVLLGTAILAAVAFRHLPPTGGSGPAEEAEPTGDVAAPSSA